MRLANYEVAYKTLHPMVPDADNFGLFEHIRETDVEKCKWIASIYEVLEEAYAKYAEPILKASELWEDRDNFYCYYSWC